MELRKRLPLYLGLSVFIISVLFVSVKLGEKNFVINSSSKAAVGTTLFMDFVKPNLISVNVLSDKPVGGIDVVIKYDRNKLDILSSTLKGGPGFTSTGGVRDEGKGVFSFSVLPMGELISKGIVATFEVSSKQQDLVASSLEFLEGIGNTTVLEGESGQPVGVKTEGINFSLK